MKYINSKNFAILFLLFHHKLYKKNVQLQTSVLKLLGIKKRFRNTVAIEEKFLLNLDIISLFPNVTRMVTLTLLVKRNVAWQPR